MVLEVMQSYDRGFLRLEETLDDSLAVYRCATTSWTGARGDELLRGEQRLSAAG